MIKRLFVEKKKGYRVRADKLKSDFKHVLGISAEDVRVFLRYDVEGLDGEDFVQAVTGVFSEPPVDEVYAEELPNLNGYSLIASEFLPGQYDQRADSAAQCVQLLTLGARPLIRCASVYAVAGVGAEQCEKIAAYLINPVEARRASLNKPDTLVQKYDEPEPAAVLDGFIAWPRQKIDAYHAKMGFAMSAEDLLFVQAHFLSEHRDPTVTELRVIDTYWSDHCRHTTFLTYLADVKIESEIPQIRETYETYQALFEKHYKGRTDKYPCLMDLATIGARELKSRGLLDNLDASDEINACSVKVTAVVDGKNEDWLVMFKNETHNHPTEIEPFGGAATCLGGAIRDPLSGRVYVYQAMRVTGAGDINAPFAETVKGKLPQRVISKTAASGFSSYGNQIGLATGGVHEIYHDGYVAKRLETGFVVGAAPEENVLRFEPVPGDAVLLIGGETGRDGCGGATGSSKAHTVESIETCGAEVQKGNPLTERKIQRLFRNREVTRRIKRCNDFGAGGVSVAIGELSPGLDIDLDVVPKKYYGLSATELAISESQERMAVVVDPKDADETIALCAAENLTATRVACVTDTRRMRMTFGGKRIVDLSREFLDSNGVRQRATAVVKEAAARFFSALDADVEAAVSARNPAAALAAALGKKNVCSQKGLGETFDSTIGAGTVLMPFGGRTQLTPSIAMAAKLPVTGGVTETATIAAYGFNADLTSQSPFTGAVYSVLLSVEKAVCAGAPFDTVRLTFQEFFERLYADPERWGKPTAALLGALHAQLSLGLAAIGGKDSMSGSFENIDVPPTLISFALGVGDARTVIDNVLKKAGRNVYRVRLKRDRNHLPDLGFAVRFLRTLEEEIASKRVSFASVAEEGGAAAAAAKSAFGNLLGFAFAGEERELFEPALGDVLLCCDRPDAFDDCGIELLGSTTDYGYLTFGGTKDGKTPDPETLPVQKKLALQDAVKAFTGTFERVYPTVAPAEGVARNVIFTAGAVSRRAETAKKTAVPKVFIPVFPGTNCEYDTAKRFLLAGAEPVTFVVKNRSANELNQSVDEMARLIRECQMIAFPGGFSGGDEPDGSGKFIATAFRNGKISEAVSELLYKRDGLALGICNGFQALVKLGLLPDGKITALAPDSPTLTYNNISRHVSTVVRVRVASTLSPWLAAVKPGEVYSVAVSHGEGKFVAPQEKLEELARAGQIATQYADLDGNATMASPFNPNGSMMAVEGITNADGRVFGKMGHSERIGSNLMKNVDGDSDMKIFESGVAYFK